MARRLKIRRFAVINTNFLRLGAYRMKVTVEDDGNTGADPNVFLFLRRETDPVTGQQLDDFHAVASPADMAEYPISEPNGQTTYPFFRHHTFEVDFRAVRLADEAFTIIVREVGILVEALNTLDTLTQVAEISVGDDADAGNSQSDSQSQSESQ